MITGNFGTFMQNSPDLMFSSTTDTVLDGTGASVGTIGLQQSATSETLGGSFVVKQAKEAAPRVRKTPARYYFLHCPLLSVSE